MTESSEPIGCQEWAVRLAQYVDDELGRADRGAVERHLRECVACAAGLADLLELKRMLGSLQPTAADRRALDDWPVVAARLATTPRLQRAHRRVIPSHAMWLAAAAALFIAATTVVARRLGSRAPGRGDAAGSTATIPTAPAGYDAATSDLGRVIDAGKATLPPEMVVAVNRSLALLDGAITETRTALAKDPGNDLIARQLADLRRRKLDAMRDVAAIVARGT